MGVFDAFDIRSAPGVLLASIQRSDAQPLEDGYIGPTGDWIPEPKAKRVRGKGFGIDGGGNPYFDSSGATPGELADLWIDPQSGDVWLEEGTGE